MKLIILIKNLFYGIAIISVLWGLAFFFKNLSIVYESVALSGVMGDASIFAGDIGLALKSLSGCLFVSTFAFLIAILFRAIEQMGRFRMINIQKAESLS